MRGKAFFAFVWIVAVALLSLPALASAGEWGSIADGAAKQTSNKGILEYLDRSVDSADGSHLGEAIAELRSAQGDKPALRQKIVTILRLMDSAEGFSASTAPSGKSPSALAKEIVARDEYRVKKAPAESNWLQQVFEGFGKWFSNLFKAPEPRKGSNFNGSWLDGAWLLGLVEFLRILLVVLIAGALILAIVLGIRQFNISSRTFLDEGEELRTREEYLDLAEQLVQSGDLRQAIRALYVASLLRLDELKIARFDRSDTNWEHLARFESSSKRPIDVDFRAVTQSFDRFWYGRVPVLIEDVVSFRQVHDRLASMEVPK